ncbi:MAG: carbamate kinase [Gemmatimonadetes bacterium]|nr:carbamate kinase [Gemmatimonadota bacterium]
MKVVVGLGGNALLRRGEPLTGEAQRRNVVAAARSLAEVARDHALVVTHGNGPQVGLLALQDASMPNSGNFSLDVLGAQTEGMIGYLLAQELRNEAPEVRVATILTQVEVDPADPAFGAPTKPVGPVYDAEQARALAAQRRWDFAPDGAGIRRVVPSPAPRRVLEIDTIRLLVEAGTVVICAGGGGIPVVFNGWGRVHGVEAVIDKDRSAALVAEELGADALLLLTDVRAVMAGWGTPEERALDVLTLGEADSGAFPAGSMGPKVEAAAAFVRATGGMAAIGALEDAVAILRGDAGTRIVTEA